MRHRTETVLRQLRHFRNPVVKSTLRSGRLITKKVGEVLTKVEQGQWVRSHDIAREQF